MSALASCYLLDRSAVPGLAEAARAEPVVIPAATPRWPLLGKIRNRIGWRVPTPPIVVSPVYDYLEEHDRGVSGGCYDWSGYGLMYLMFLLEDTGTPLGTAEYPAETEVVNAAYSLTYLITSEDKRHLAALDPARLDDTAAERFFDGAGFRLEEGRQALEEGLVLLHRLIAALHEDEVLVIHIG